MYFDWGNEAARRGGLLLCDTSSPWRRRWKNPNDRLTNALGCGLPTICPRTIAAGGGRIFPCEMDSVVGVKIREQRRTCGSQR